MFEFTIVIAVAVLSLLLVATAKNGLSWLSSRQGRGVLFGLILAPLAAAVVALLGGCSSVEVFAGLESTKNLSPQCVTVGASDRATSNLGVQGCRSIGEDGRTSVCGVYRHHSCAINSDRESYDGAGFYVSRRLWLSD